MKVVTKGAETTTGGVVLEGHNACQIDFKPVTVVGQKATCSSGRKSCKGVGEIVPINPDHYCYFMGINVVLDGYKVLCNCDDNFVIANTQTIDIGYDNGVGQGTVTHATQAYSSTSQIASSANHAVSNATNATAVPSSLANTVASSQIADETEKADDIDETYIMFSDKNMSLEELAEQAYLSTKPEVISHLKKVNIHLSQAGNTILKGMPVVISPWSKTDSYEVGAIAQVNELTDEFLTLTPEQQAWFADYHEEFTNALITASLVPESHLYEVDGEDVKEVSFVPQMLAAGGAGIAGAQVQADNIFNRLKRFEGSSKYIGEVTKNLTDKQLSMSPDYKIWRRQARELQAELQSFSKQLGAPSYIKRAQINKVNKLLNVSKRQLYRAADFSKLASSIELTPLYKQAMKFSKYLGKASWISLGIGIKNNVEDILFTCAKDGMFSEACRRAEVRNGASIAINSFVGNNITGLGVRFAPATKGLSIIPTVAGAYYWGLYGGNASDFLGEGLEYIVFDSYDDVVEWIGKNND